MNDYLKTLQEIDRSTQQLLSGEYHSLESEEIKDAAIELSQSVQPCIEEIREFAHRLKDAIQTCLKDLEYAEEVWNSKRRVAELPEAQIWEQLGNFAGYQLKIQQISEACQKEIIDEAQAYWQRKFESLKKQVFIDEKNQMRTAIGWSDKEKFRKEISPLTKSFSRKLDQLIEDGFSKILRQLNSIPLEETKSCINLLDSNSAIELRSELITVLHKMVDLFTQKVGTAAKGKTYSPSIADVFHPYIDAWNKRFGDIAWGEVSGFSSAVLQRAEKRVKTTIEDRISVVNEALQKAIAFYNYFLEIQTRYKAETPEQKLAEKAWIDQQRQKLQQLQRQLSLLDGL